MSYLPYEQCRYSTTPAGWTKYLKFYVLNIPMNSIPNFPVFTSVTMPLYSDLLLNHTFTPRLSRNLNFTSRSVQ